MRGFHIFAPVLFVVAVAPWGCAAPGGLTEPSVVELWPGSPPGVDAPSSELPRLTLFLPERATPGGAAVIVFPGGGYEFLADSEGAPIARWLSSFGVTAFVLRYRHGPEGRHPAPFEDASRAVRVVRARSREWGLDPTKIGVMGFSAGGHLAATVGTRHDPGDGNATDVAERQSSRPDFLVLVYPVISMQDPHTHRGSRAALTGQQDPAPELLAWLSNELHVTPETPPTFLVHTNADQIVPPENSVLFYEALRRAGVPAELHIFRRGGHGLGLGREGDPFSSWPALCRRWIEAFGSNE